MILRKFSEGIIHLEKFILDLVLPPMTTSFCLADVSESSSASSAIDVDFSESHILRMAVPKRSKSNRMKRFERNRPWKIPKDIPYTSCSDCGSPRLVYFMCETCYAKTKEVTREKQEENYAMLREMKANTQMEKVRLRYKPAPYEDKIQPYLEKYTMERLKPQPIEPDDEAWKSTIDEYKNWYLEDGQPVVKPKTDADIELIPGGNENFSDDVDELK